VLKLDDAVSAAVTALKERGMTSPYLKPLLVARVNPIRFSKSTEFELRRGDGQENIVAAQKFKVEKVRQEDLARAAGGPPDEE
jgi:ParB family transcriptional regulator, chromosome partitioning protein